MYNYSDAKKNENTLTSIQPYAVLAKAERDKFLQSDGFAEKFKAYNNYSNLSRTVGLSIGYSPETLASVLDNDNRLFTMTEIASIE